MNLHDEIMNLPVGKSFPEKEPLESRILYKEGHRDARHAAAELAATAQAAASAEQQKCGYLHNSTMCRKCGWSAGKAQGEPDYRYLFEMCKREKKAAYARLAQYEDVKRVNPAGQGEQKPVAWMVTFKRLGSLTFDRLVVTDKERIEKEVDAKLIQSVHPLVFYNTRPQADEKLREALTEASSVLSSINYGPGFKVTLGGEAVFWQREEWLLWARNEVLPLVRAALASLPASNTKEE